ncbi:MAG: hypothetical protein LBB11_04065 [Puniceicoccales bacterium]|jgi:hypothetical protein|nr:hypothetical protein [Puniceicoccales bacterium]
MLNITIAFFNKSRCVIWRCGLRVLYIFATALIKHWSVTWRFLFIASWGCVFLNKIEVPSLECRISVPPKKRVYIVDVAKQKKEIEKISTKTLFFGPSDEEIPEDLKLQEWEPIEYIEPIFLFP